MKKTSFKDISDWIIALCASTVLYVIPVVSQTLHNGLVTAKYFTLLVCMFPFAFSVTLYLLIRRHELRQIRLTWIDGITLVGTIYYTLNVCLAGNGDPTRLIFASQLLLWYWGLRILFTSERIFRILRLLLLCTAGYEALLGLAQCYGSISSHHSLYTATGSFYNPGPFGGFLALFAPIALYGTLTRDKQHAAERWIATIVISLILIILPVTMSRTAWAASLVGCTVTLIHLYAEPMKQWAARHRAVCIATVTTIGIIILTGSLAAWHMKRDSADGRILIWKTTIGIIECYLLTGCGFGHFAGAYGQQQAERFVRNDLSQREVYVAGTPEDAFNEYLQTMAEGGVIGGLLFITAAGAGIWGLWRRLTATGGLCFGAIALLIFASASYPFSLAEFILTGIFLLAAAAPAAPGITLPSRGLWSVWILIAWPTVYICWQHERPRAEAYRTWQIDHLMYDMKLYEQVVRSATSQYALLNTEPRFLYEYGHALHFTGEYAHSNEILSEGATQSADPMFWNVMGNNYKAMDDPASAERCYLHAYYTLPNRLYPLYLLARLYYDTGQRDKLLPVCDRILEFREKIPSPATTEMKQQAATWRQFPHPLP